jgi:hypothetical protein
MAAACAADADSGGASVESAELALEQAALTAQLDSLVADAADRNSRFDIGQGFEGAAEQLKLQLHAELPCAVATRVGSTLNITYDGQCVTYGRALTGQHTVRVMRNADNEVGVHHEFSSFGDARLLLSGSADVTWSRTSRTRRVQHWLTFQALSGPGAGLVGESNGDSTQMYLDDHVRINGFRQWHSSEGPYSLDLHAIEQRFADSVPQLGAYALTIPSDAALTLAFGRIDTDNIRVTVQGAQRELAYVIGVDGTLER